MIRSSRWIGGLLAFTGSLVVGASVVAAQTRTRDDWVALAKSGFVLPPGVRAVVVLIEMNTLLGSPDPVLRDEVAYSAAARWILRDSIVDVADLRRLLALWTSNLDDGLGDAGDDRTLKRSFSALCLSVAAARHATTAVFTDEEAQRLTERLVDYLDRERDLRGLDPGLGWIHATAHAADALKFLARGRGWSPATLGRVLQVTRGKILEHDGVFIWGEAERLAAMLHAAVRRPDAELARLAPWLEQWEGDHQALWAKGPHVDRAAYARVENAKQLLRALHALLAMEATPSAPAVAARQVVLTTLARLR